MSNKEFFAASLTNEFAAFTKVLNAVPADKLEYRPHEKSRSARELAWTIAEEFDHIAGILDHGNIYEKGTPAPETKEEIVSHFTKATAIISQRLKSTTEEHWNKLGKFVIMGNEVGTMPASTLAWIMHNDLIHHRGQLSVYLRPMGAKVPSIYGPSADEQS